MQFEAKIITLNWIYNFIWFSTANTQKTIGENKFLPILAVCIVDFSISLLKKYANKVWSPIFFLDLKKLHIKNDKIVSKLRKNSKINILCLNNKKKTITFCWIYIFLNLTYKNTKVYIQNL